MSPSRIAASVAGLGAAAVTVLYLVVMTRQDDLARETFHVSLITATFASSSAALLASLFAATPRRRLVLLAWGTTVALFWTLLVNTLTPLWLAVAVLGGIPTVGAARSFRREGAGGSGWGVFGVTSAVCVTVLGVTVFGSIALDRAPASGSGQAVVAPR